tara:strand:- start:1184 stop:1417 length:234 start_codon:yes stop_codon:yes gene_type:complete
MNSILNDTIKEYYLMVKYDLEDGCTEEMVQIGLRDLEEDENYLACAGVQMALQEHLTRQKDASNESFDTLIDEIING